MSVRESHEPAHYSLQPREVLLFLDEQQSLADTTRDYIQEAFLYHDYAETIVTERPVHLSANPACPPNPSFGVIMPRVYDQAKIDVTVDHIDNETSLREAKIVLYKKGVPMDIHSELYITADEYGYEGGIDVDDPQFYLVTPSRKKGEQNDVVFLDDTALSDILDGLLAQADPDRIHKSDLLIIEKIFALLDKAPELQVNRRMKYRFSHPAHVGRVVVGLHDTYTSKPGEIPAHSGHGVDIETAQSLADPDVAVSRFTLTQKSAEIETKFGLHYLHYGNDDRGDHFEELIQRETDSVNDLENSYPSRFGQKVLSGLTLLRELPEGYKKESITDEF